MLLVREGSLHSIILKDSVTCKCPKTSCKISCYCLSKFYANGIFKSFYYALEEGKVIFSVSGKLTEEF